MLLEIWDKFPALFRALEVPTQLIIPLEGFLAPGRALIRTFPCVEARMSGGLEGRKTKYNVFDDAHLVDSPLHIMSSLK